MIKYLVAVIFGFFVVSLVYLRVSLEPMLLSKLLYPAESLMVLRSVDCQSLPGLLQAEFIRSINEFSTKNQISYFDGRSTQSCSSGWIGAPYFSRRIGQKDPFRFASLTKPLTGAAVLKLVSEGRLSLFAPIHEVLSIPKEKFKDPKVAETTVQDLLRHRNGFVSSVFGVGAMDTPNERPWCPYDLTPLRALVKTESIITTRYDNLNYCLLGKIIENASGMSYRDYMVKHIFKGQDLQFVDGAPDENEVRYDYRFEKRLGERSWRKFDLFALSSAAGLKGSTEDYVSVLRSGNEASGGLLFKPSEDCNTISGRCFALSLEQVNSFGQDFLIHTGYMPGVTSVLVVDKYRRIVVLVSAGVPRTDMQAGVNSRVQKIMSFLASEPFHDG